MNDKAQSEVTGLILVTLIVVLMVVVVGIQVITQNPTEEPSANIDIKNPTDQTTIVQLLNKQNSEKIYLVYPNGTKIKNKEINENGQIVTTEEKKFNIIAQKGDTKRIISKVQK